MIEDLIAEIQDESFELISEIIPTRTMYTPLDVRCYLSEVAVFNVLKKFNFKSLIDFPINASLDWVRDDRGIKVIKNKCTLHEFDEIGYIHGDPFLIEVKSSKMNGYSKKIGRAFNFGKILFEEIPSQIIFLPFRYNTKILSSKFDVVSNMYYVDTGWSKKQLTSAVNNFYDFNNSSNV